MLLRRQKAGSDGKETRSASCERTLGLGGADSGSELRAITPWLSAHGQITSPSLGLNFTICGMGTIRTPLKKYGEAYI